MCKFASFILTKNDAFYLEHSDSHEDIIAFFHLRDDYLNLVRVELTPPNDLINITNPDSWSFKVDQFSYPDWTYKGDPTLQQISRKALNKRIQEQKIGHIFQASFAQTALSGQYGKSTSGNYGHAISGHYGSSIVGFNGKAISGDYGISISKDFGSSISGCQGTSISGDFGNSTSSFDGTSIAGARGKSISGINGKAKAGEYGQINISYYDSYNNRDRTLVAYVGENGILPNIFYQVENGKFVPAE